MWGCLQFSCWLAMPLPKKNKKMQKGSSLGSFFVTLPWPGSFLYRWQANRKIATPWVRCLPFGVKLPCVQVRDLTLHDVTGNLNACNIDAGNLNSGMQSIFSEPVFLHQYREMWSWSHNGYMSDYVRATAKIYGNGKLSSSFGNWTLELY
jgi:hypothetical protein